MSVARTSSKAPDPTPNNERRREDQDVQYHVLKTCTSILEQIDSCLSNRSHENPSVSGACSLVVALPELQDQWEEKVAHVKRIVSETLDEPIETFVGIVGTFLQCEQSVKPLVSG
eukprot:1079421-Prorocentrum_minimum.AAC.3